MGLGIISVTKNGDKIAYNISQHFESQVYCKSNLQDFKLNKIIEKIFYNIDGIVFISSTGIAVRAIAPFIEDKTKDPAVIVVDSTGKYVISLLSGHIGGANKLAIKIANLIGAEPIITTATDNLNITAPDVFAKEKGLIIEDMKNAKKISSLLIEGRKVAFIDEQGEYDIPNEYEKSIDDTEGVVVVSNKNKIEEEYLNKTVLRLIRKNVVIGIGCRKSFNSIDMKNKVYEKLKEYNINFMSILKVVTVEVKKEEAAIIELSKVLNAEFEVFTLEQIKKVQYKYEGSDFVEKTIGVRAVCEPCVELSGAKLITGKIKCDGMTICIGLKL